MRSVAVSRLMTVLKVHPGEMGLVMLVIGMLFFANTGFALGTLSIDALFYARFGVEYLPVMYIMLGVTTIVSSLLLTALSARVRQQQLSILLPGIMALLILVARVVLISGVPAIYPVLWLGASIFSLLQSLAIWGLASLACNTRQAKRLFPLFGVGGILGLTIGCLLVRPLVNIVGAENLIIAWAVCLGVVLLLSIWLVRTRLRIMSSSAPLQKPVGILTSLLADFRYVRDTALLRRFALASVAISVLLYAVAFPFSSAVAGAISDENDLAGFLGLFFGISLGAATLVSLLLANRLYARFGFMTTILVYPVIFLVGFAVSAIRGTFLVLVIFRFVQVVWSAGVVDSATQALYNVVPPEKRGKSRTFVQGIAGQVGISMAGVMLFLSASALDTQHIFIIGALAALIAAFLVRQARRSYGSAVVAALRAGQANVFFSDEKPFGGFPQDATAITAAIASLRSRDVTERRVAADILGRLSPAEAKDAIVNGLNDEDPAVRAALLRAIGRADDASATLEVAGCLRDLDPGVRAEAVSTLDQLAAYARGITALLEPMLTDPDPVVQSRVASALLKRGPHPAAEALLREAALAEGRAGDVIRRRLLALEALAEWGSQHAYELAAAGLHDPLPAIRRASATIMARIDAEQCVFALNSALGDSDASVREAVAAALGSIGEPVLEMVVSSLNEPGLADGALLTLQRLPARKAKQPILDYAHAQVAKSRHYHQLWLYSQVTFAGEREARGNVKHASVHAGGLLTDSLRQKAYLHGINALRAMSVVGQTAAINMAIENLNSRDANQRANAMETLDSMGDAAIVRPVLRLWEPQPAAITPPRDWIMVVLDDEDSWIRACGVLVAGELQSEEVSSRLDRMAYVDPDLLVRECIISAGEGEKDMESVPMLSTMERVLFLRRVPLFDALSPNDLLQIASVTEENHFADGAVIAQQGEPGNALYIIVEGEVVAKVSKNGKGGDAGEELGRRHAGDYVGEMAIISDEVRMATLIASGNVRVLRISQTQFEEILLLRPEISLAVMRDLIRRLREK